jgi:galactokinase/mevalonate kinase-like predicted kinase
MGDKREAFRNAAVPAWVAAEVFTAVEAGALAGAAAGAGKSSFMVFLIDAEI